MDNSESVRVRYEELLREADHQRLAREAIEGRRAGAARSGRNAPEGRVGERPHRRWRIRRAAA